MKKREFVFIFGLTLLAAIIWIVGELVIGLWLPIPDWTRLIWRIIIIVVTLTISIWHSFKYDESMKDARAEKYKRKTKKK